MPISISRFMLSVISPTAPVAISPSAPRIEVSGVRSSWLTIDRNSLLAR